MHNRKIAPPIFEITHLQLPRPEVLFLDNGLQVYTLHYPGQAILKVEMLFRAGRPEEDKPQVARATLRMLREGTPSFNSAAFAELIDFYGGTLSLPASLDTATCILFTLKKYAGQLIPAFGEMIAEPLFPESELETFSRNAVQDLTVELEKGEVLTYRMLTEKIYGPTHPYGYNSYPEHFPDLTRTDLVQFHQKWFTPANAMLIVSGDIDTSLLQLLNQHLGQTRKPAFFPKAYVEPVEHTPHPVHINLDKSLQIAIKLGRRTFNKHHPDFYGLYVLNTVLGGYFGSRLMMNIREKHGFTYNIYSNADTLLHDGYLYIAAEVNTDSAKKTLKEIHREMQKLREELVSPSELSMVRNYLLGALLNGLDGPLNSSDLVKTMLADNLPWDAFDHLVNTIRTISPETIRELAIRYLDPKDYWTITAGPSGPAQSGKSRKTENFSEK